ncbi:MAG: hypothetical protein IJY86_04995 [Clostridia bacterium]|nr:hypothetical protein [Clostridia bacterium]
MLSVDPAVPEGHICNILAFDRGNVIGDVVFKTVFNGPTRGRELSVKPVIGDEIFVVHSVAVNKKRLGRIWNPPLRAER